MQRTDQELLEAALAAAKKAADQLSRDQQELARAGHDEGAALATSAMESASRVARLLESSPNPERP